MKISELTQGTGKVNLTAEVVDLQAPREVTTKTGQKMRVVNATIRDASGEIALTLWNEDVDKVAVGDTVMIENGYVSGFQGKPQLSTGKFGKLTVQKSP